MSWPGRQTAQSERRIHLFAFWISVAGILTYGLLVRTWYAPLSVMLGALLAWLNFRWLSAGVEGILHPAKSNQIKYLIAKFLLRLVLISVVLCVMIRVSLSSLVGVLLGLSVYILAIMAEALFLSFYSARK